MKLTVTVDSAGIEAFFAAYAAQACPSAGLHRLIKAYQAHLAAGGYDEYQNAVTRDIVAEMEIVLKTVREMELRYLGPDECSVCGERFTATPADKLAICRRCSRKEVR